MMTFTRNIIIRCDLMRVGKINENKIILFQINANKYK